MTKTWHFRAFAVYLTLGMPLSASCAKEANTLEGDNAGDVAGSTSSAGTLNNAGTTTSNAFGGSATSGGKGGVAGSTAAEAGDSAGGTAGEGGSATGGSTTVPPEVLASAKAIVYYQTDHATASDKMIRMVLHIVNQSGNSLPMANVKIRYWFTAEAAPKLNQYYTGEDVRPPSAKFIDDGANSHVLMTFGGGTIKKGDIISRSEVQLAIDSETTAFDQANDFSWQPTSLTSKPNDKITLYLDDKLIWGCEPSGECPDNAGTGGAGGAGAGGVGAGGAGAGGDGVGGQGAGGVP